MESLQQEAYDTFYSEHGPCCAGCDHWQGINSLIGSCAKAAPVAAEERIALLDMRGSSLNIGAGHPFTPREFSCGDFVDGFDWSTLPITYRKRVGRP